MQVLGLDPGVKRLGWGAVRSDESGFHYLGSGVVELDREDGELFQAYRERIRDYWRRNAASFIQTSTPYRRPDLVAYETQPAVGSGGYNGPQSQLVKVAMLVLELATLDLGIPICPLAAQTVKKRVTGKGRATKVGVRNSVLQAFPELAPRKRELTQTADESDAIAIALAGAGYDFKLHGVG